MVTLPTGSVSVAIIEDDADMAASLADILTDEGYACQAGIVIVSAEAEIESKALRAGIRDYLRKPVDAAELLQVVQRLSE